MGYYSLDIFYGFSHVSESKLFSTLASTDNPISDLLAPHMKAITTEYLCYVDISLLKKVPELKNIELLDAVEHNEELTGRNFLNFLSINLNVLRKTDLNVLADIGYDADVFREFITERISFKNIIRKLNYPFYIAYAPEDDAIVGEEDIPERYYNFGWLLENHHRIWQTINSPKIDKNEKDELDKWLPPSNYGIFTNMLTDVHIYISG